MKRIKDWVLPIAMITGALTYQWIGRLAFLTPYLIFTMLLLTFCKISWKDIRFHPMHIWLLMIQLIGSILVYFLIRPYNEILAQGALLCLLTPTATAAAVITGMLGGNVGFLTAYLLFCNVVIAIVAPVYFTFIGVNEALTFGASVWNICRQVFPLLVFPLFLAAFLRKWVPKVHQALVRIPKLTFYIWVFALTIATGITVQFVLNNENPDYSIETGLAVIALILCCLQFFIGRRIGRRYNDPVSSGQGLGQKNTILAIWMAQMFLHPLVTVAPATYILVQNIINSYQLWKVSKARR